VVALRWREEATMIDLAARDLHLRMHVGRHLPIPLPRLRRRTAVRPFEWILARVLLGVRTSGVSPTGVAEWYRADGYRRVRTARGAWAGRDLGRLVPFPEPARFGFSEPPRRPAVVSVRPRLEDRSGHLAAVLGRRGAPSTEHPRWRRP
jgi:hypothetical protein